MLRKSKLGCQFQFPLDIICINAEQDQHLVVGPTVAVPL